MTTSPRRAVHELVSELDYPMFIVTVAGGGERAGCLVGFTTQCSIDPPRFLVCLSDKNRTFRVAGHAEVLAVHLVPSDATALTDLFGGETGDDVDKFARCRWHPGPRARRSWRSAGTGSRGASSSASTQAITTCSCSIPSRPRATRASGRSTSTAPSGSSRATRPEPRRAASLSRPRR